MLEKLLFIIGTAIFFGGGFYLERRFFVNKNYENQRLEPAFKISLGWLFLGFFTWSIWAMNLAAAWGWTNRLIIKHYERPAALLHFVFAITATICLLAYLVLMIRGRDHKPWVILRLPQSAK